MPPEILLLNGVIAAAGAVIGVFVAQLWTTRREDRQWGRQMQLYTQQWDDRRERDREQREDQRQRERELWKREDRYRFVEHRRDAYASYLAKIQGVLVRCAMAELRVYTFLTGSGQVDDQAALDFAAVIRAAQIALGDMRDSWAAVDLLAPLDLQELAALLADKLREDIGSLERRQTRNHVDARTELVDKIRAAMRRDLMENE